MAIRLAPGHGLRPPLRPIPVLLGVVIALVIIALAAFALWKFRANALERAERSLANLAIILAEQTDRALESMGLILDACAASARQALQTPSPAAAGTLVQELRTSIAEAPQLRALVVYDISGKAIAFSDHVPAHWDNLSGIGLGSLYTSGVPGPIVGNPLARESETKDTIPLAYHITDGHGRTLGGMVAFVNPSYFVRLYRSLDLGNGGRAMLLNRSGVLLTGYPLRPEWVGHSFANSALLASIRSAAGATMRQRGLLDDVSRVTAARKLDNSPLVVVVSMTEHHVLAQWRATAQQFGSGAIGSALLTLFLLLLLARQLRIAEATRTDLRQSAQRLDGIIQSAMDAIITVDRQQRILLFNAAAQRVFRCPASEAIGSPLDRFLPARFRSVHRAHVERFGATGVTNRRMGDRMALAALRADGEEFPIDASISQAIVGGEKVYTVILRDITEQRRAEKEMERSRRQLRELAAVTNGAREAERTRIARELHDELAQWLTALKMDVAWLEARLPPGTSEMMARMARMGGIIDDTVKAVRRIAANLRPTMLDDLGPVAALEWLAQDFSERSGIAVKMNIAQADHIFQEPLATAVFRIVQEALTNVARHACATEVFIELQVDSATLKLRVSDNGHGADLAVLEQSGSYGLLGIRERAHTLGGTTEFTSSPGSGFIIEIVIPLDPYRGETVAA